MDHPVDDRKDPAIGEGLETVESQSAERREYVKPAIDDGAELPTATAQGFTPGVLLINGGLVSA